jgi:amidophosphoribosyltransferase
MSVDEICKSIGADSLGYLSVDNVKRLAGNSDCGFCVGCFNEKYPIEVPKEMPKDKFESRISDSKNK